MIIYHASEEKTFEHLHMSAKHYTYISYDASQILMKFPAFSLTAKISRMAAICMQRNLCSVQLKLKIYCVIIYLEQETGSYEIFCREKMIRWAKKKKHLLFDYIIFKKVTSLLSLENFVQMFIQRNTDWFGNEEYMYISSIKAQGSHSKRYN